MNATELCAVTARIRIASRMARVICAEVEG